MRTGVLLVSDRELKKPLRLPTIHKRTGPRIQLPVWRRELGRGEKGQREEERRVRGEGTGKKQGNRTERERTQTRRVTSPSKTE